MYYVYLLRSISNPSKTYTRYRQKALIDGVEIFNEKFYDQEFIAFIIQSILRNKIGCKLESNDMFVHFGWDFYMYIGCSKLCKSTLEKIKDLGLFVEEFESPYLPEDEEITLGQS